MIACPANGVDSFAIFNGNGAVYQDNVQSYSTTEPAIDLTATSFLMWSWRSPKPLNNHRGVSLRGRGLRGQAEFGNSLDDRVHTFRLNVDPMPHAVRARMHCRKRDNFRFA